MKPLALILAFAAVSAAQKPLKAGKKPAYIAHSPGGGAGHAEASPQYQAAPASPQGSVSNHGGFSGGHHGGSFSSGIGKGGSKANIPLLLSDTRTLNPDGTINFDFKADNGLHQGESVDSDGTRRGFYSYPGADGKLITVKYTAGKNGYVPEIEGFQVPKSAPHNPKHQDDIYSSGKQGSFGGGHGGGHYPQAAPQHHGGASHHGGAGHHGGAYRPGGSALGGHNSQANHYSHSSGGAGSHGGHSGGGASFANFPDFSSHFPSSSSGHGGAPSYSSGAGRPGASGHHGGHGQHQVAGHPGGSSSFSSLSGLGGGGGGGHGGHAAPNFADLGSSLGGHYNGPMFTATNPYQPSLAAANPGNPVNAGFDLGNGGHFSINFTPGVGQEYNPNELSGDYSGHQGGGQHGGGSGSYSGNSGHGGGAQGRY